MNAIATIEDTTHAVVTDFVAASTPKTDLSRRIAEQANELLTSRSGGIKGLATGRSDIFRVNPFVLSIKEGWNSRDKDSPENIAHVDHLARSIAANGVQEPLTVYLEDGRPVVTDGHCRLLATFRAIEEYGAEIATVPVKTEPKTSSEAERLASQIIRNSGKPLSAFETGNVFRRLNGYGWSTQDIANKFALTPTRVTQILELQAAPNEIRRMVIEGRVSSTLAWETLRNSGSDEEAIATLKAALETAASKGKSKATRKHVENSGRKSTSQWVKNAFLTASEKGLIDNSEEDRVLITIELSPEEFAVFQKKFKL